jgi:hypothetical protein
MALHLGQPKPSASIERENRSGSVQLGQSLFQIQGPSSSFIDKSLLKFEKRYGIYFRPMLTLSGCNYQSTKCVLPRPEDAPSIRTPLVTGKSVTDIPNQVPDLGIGSVRGISKYKPLKSKILCNQKQRLFSMSVISPLWICGFWINLPSKG